MYDLLFPGYYQLLDENTFVLGLKIFRKYYHPDIVKKKKENHFISEVDNLAKKLGHRGVGITLANKIYTLAQKTIPSRPNNQYSQLSTIAYAGQNSPPYQSGQFEATNRHISKRGNKYLKKTGYEIMKSIKSS